VTREGVVISGPGRVTKYLKVDRAFYGMHSHKGSELYIEWNKKKNKGIIAATPRIGINYAGKEWINKKWRYVLTLPKYFDLNSLYDTVNTHASTNI
jgi:3-methyladenine DNA glycosylase Mpg